MDIQLITNLLTSIISQGNRKACLFDRLRLLDIKEDLERSNSINQLILGLSKNKPFLLKAFGLSNTQFEEGIHQIRNCVKIEEDKG